MIFFCPINVKFGTGSGPVIFHGAKNPFLDH